MNRINRTLVAALVGALLVVTACSGDRAGTVATGHLPDAFRDRDASAVDLFAVYSDALVAKDAVVLDELLGDEFLLQRTNGTWVDKAGFLGRLPNLRSFTVANLTEQRGTNVIVARMDATGDLSVDGTQYRTSSAPMLVVFEWAEGHWVLQAQGNFNLPGA